MVEWIVKKVLVGRVNDLLKQYSKNVSKAKETLRSWISRIRKVLSALESALAKLDDGELSAEELKQTVDEVTNLVKEW